MRLGNLIAQTETKEKETTMPCRDSRDDNCPDDNAQRTINALQKRLDKVTRLLCETCNFIYTHPVVRQYERSHELNKWWTDHKAADEKRLAKEKKDRIREYNLGKIYAKLSNDELNILQDELKRKHNA
jgi:hypothetical protein